MAKQSPNLKPALQIRVEKFYPFLIIATLAFVVSDLGILLFRPQLFPDQAPPAIPLQVKIPQQKHPESYYTITSRNMFNSDGKIPSASKEELPSDLDLPAIASTLPLKLMGTIVHLNNKRSVASILENRKNKVTAYMIGDDIDGMAEITKIERRKVTFRNRRTRRLEYIDIPKDFTINLGLSANTTTPAATNSLIANDLVREVSPNQFEVPRSQVNAMTKGEQMDAFLQSGSVTPNYDPATREQKGFRFRSIKPGGPLDKMGFRVGDVILGAEGEVINNPMIAMRMLGDYKNAKDLTLMIIRDGKQQELKYSITE